MKLNHSELRSFVYGSILGDGYIHHGSFVCKQVNKDLVQFKKNIFQRYINDSKITEYDAYTDKNGVNHKKSYELYVYANRYLKKIKAYFSNGINREFLNRLTPLGLAIWYADDGTTVLVGKNEETGGSKRRRVQICTDRYSEEEVEIMMEYFKEKYGYDVSKKRRDNNTFRIQINGKYAQDFLEMISPYFEKYFPSLLYKMDLGYRNESLKNERYVTQSYDEMFSRIKTYPLFIDRMINR